MRSIIHHSHKSLLGRSLLVMALSSSVFQLPTVAIAASQDPAPQVPAPQVPAPQDSAPQDPSPATNESSSSTNLTAAPASEGQPPAPENASAAATDNSIPDQSAAGAEVQDAADLGMLESTSEAKELNVPPKDMVPLYEKDRPEWLFKAPTIQDGKLVIYVGGELCNTEEECEKKQAEAMYAEVCKYFDTEVFHEADASLGTPLTSELIANRWVDKKENYVAKVQTSEGTMYQLWSIVRIDDEGIKTMKQWHLSTVQPTRVRSLGIGLVSVLSGIGLIHLGARFAGRRSRKKG